MSEAVAPVPDSTRPGISPLEIVRVVVLIVALASLAIWGFSMWAFPWTLVFGIGAPVVVLLVWALFLSPRPVLRLDSFIRAAVELLIYAGVTLAWWSMGQAWAGIAFAVVAVVAGVVSGRRSLR